MRLKIAKPSMSVLFAVAVAIVLGLFFFQPAPAASAQGTKPEPPKVTATIMGCTANLEKEEITYIASIEYKNLDGSKATADLRVAEDECQLIRQGKETTMEIELLDAETFRRTQPFIGEDGPPLFLFKIIPYFFIGLMVISVISRVFTIKGKVQRARRQDIL